MPPGLHKATGTDKVIIVKRFGDAERAKLARHRACTQLALHGTTHDDLAFVHELPRCRSLELVRTKIASYDALGTLRSLRHLFLSGIVDHEDLAFISGLPQLTALSLLYLPKLARFPSLRRCTKLARVTLWQCKRLADLDELVRLPKLEEVSIVDTPHRPDDLVPLLRHPHLKYVSAQLGSQRDNDRFAALLAEHGKAARRRG